MSQVRHYDKRQARETDTHCARVGMGAARQLDDGADSDVQREDNERTGYKTHRSGLSFLRRSGSGSLAPKSQDQNHSGGRLDHRIKTETD
jgi:hypothetical protein